MYKVCNIRRNTIAALLTKAKRIEAVVTGKAAGIANDTRG